MRIALFLSLVFLVISCLERPQGVIQKCVITSIEEKQRYGGTIPDVDYLIKTDCGYTFYRSNNFHQVGDTILVEVIDLQRKN